MTHTARQPQQKFPDASRVFGPESAEARVYAHVEALLSKLGPQFRSVSLGSVAHALGWSTDAALNKAIVRALDQLSYGETAVLERQFLLWPVEHSPEVLAEPQCRISELEMRRALESNVLVVSQTGEQVRDFLDRVTVEYVVTDIAHGLTSDSSRGDGQ